MSRQPRRPNIIERALDWPPLSEPEERRAVYAALALAATLLLSMVLLSIAVAG